MSADLVFSCERFVGGAWTPLNDADKATLPDVNALTVLSYNVLYSKEHLRRRMDALLALIEEHEPDFIALQEMTEAHDDVLRSSAYIRCRYSTCSPKRVCGGASSFTVCVWSRFDAVKLLMFDAGKRDALMAFYTLGDGTTLSFASVHLSPGSSSSARADQLDNIRTRSSDADAAHSIIVGDFNACQPLIDDRSIKRDGYIDCWPAYASGANCRDEGWTRKHGGETVRLDRLALRSERWTRVCRFDRLGMSPIEGAEPPIHISDHFGILVVIEQSNRRTDSNS
jgi:endonuclease/exonuclease/phosphatase family metal-dependent hydrolase